METEQQGWKEVYEIDKTIVENAAQHFDGAREFLKAIKQPVAAGSHCPSEMEDKQDESNNQKIECSEAS